MTHQKLIPGKRYWLTRSEHAEFVRIGEPNDTAYFKDITPDDGSWMKCDDGTMPFRQAFAENFKEVTP